MNSFNDIKRIKYLDNQDSVVSLSEYVIFSDDRKKEKFIVFKFDNNLNQILHGIRFEIVQHDESGAIIEKSVIKYNKVSIGKNETFVPESKLRVQYSCAKISANLLYAHFTTTIWENGKFTPVKISFDDYKNDIPNTKTAKQVKREIKRAKQNAKLAKIQQKTTERIRASLATELYSLNDGQASSVNRKNRFQIKDVSRRGKPWLARLLAFFISIVLVVSTLSMVLGFSTQSSFLLNVSSSNEFSSGDFDYSVDNNAVIGYFGDDQQVEISDKASFSYEYSLGEYVSYGLSYVNYLMQMEEMPTLDKKTVKTIEVLAIGNRAFESKPITKVILPSTVSKFGTEAFVDCQNLTQISYKNANGSLNLGKYSLKNTGFVNFEYDFVSFVDEFALSNCSSLVKVNVPKATVAANAFDGSTGIEVLTFKSTDALKLVDLFGGVAPTNLKEVNISANVPDGFLKGFENNNIKFNGSYNINSNLF